MGNRLQGFISKVAKVSEAIPFPRRSPTDDDLSRVIEERTHPVVRSILKSFGFDRGNLIQKDARSIVPESVTTYGFLQEPPYDPFTLQIIADRHWVVRTCRDKLAREAIRKGWRWEPAYELRCEACDAKYDYSPLSEVCPACGGELEKPDAEQLVRVDAFLDHPNPSDSMLDILEKNARDLLTFDDFYVTVATPSPTSNVSQGNLRPAIEVWPEDARFMKIEADGKGRLGGRTFCPIEEDSKQPGVETRLYDPVAFPAGAPCPKGDEGTLQQMSYAQVYGSEVVAAFSENDVLHDNLFATGSRLYGTPKLWALQTQITAMMLIDTYQKDSFEKAKTPKNIFLWKGLSDGDMKRILKQQEEAKKFNTMADMHVPIPIQPGVQQGAFGVDVVRGIDTPLIQGSIQFQEFYFKAICYTFGIDPASIGVETPGRLGGSQGDTVAKGVSQESVQQIQVQLSEAWDRFLKLKFSEVKDWKWTLETAYEEEEADVWTTKKIQMETAKIAVDAGFNVKIDETGIPVISGAGKRQEIPSPFGRADALEDGGKVASETASTAIAETTSTSVEKSGEDTDIEKASRWQRDLIAASKDYKDRLDVVSKFIADAVFKDLDDVLGPGPSEPVTEELRDILVSRTRKVLELAATEVAPMLENAAVRLYRYGQSMGLADINKQDVDVAFDEEDAAAIRAFYERTQDAMKNTLYFGDKQTYLSKIRDVIQACISEGGCTTRILARRLAAELDPEEEHFSDYMWERIARTETSAYVTAGRIKAYEEFDIPKVRRIVASDAVDELCAPFSNVIYRTEDAYGVIPSHPFCKCAWAPYLGDEEPIDSSQIIYNG